SAMKYFKAVSVALIAIVVIFAVLIVLMPKAFPFLPAQLAERLEGISFEGGTVKERMVFYNDAFNLYKDHNPVIGSGGGAWQYMYGMYQSYLYYTSQAHSYIMQVLVEAGALGFILWSLAIILFFVQLIRALKKGTTDRNILSAIACVGTSLILHSFIDFDLSLPAILLILWIVIALCDASSPEITKEFKINKIAVSVVCAALLVISGMFLIGSTAYNKGVEILNSENPDRDAISEQFKTAATSVPICPEYKIAHYVHNNEQGASMSSDDVDALLSKDPMNIRTIEYAYTFYNRVNDYRTCMSLVERVINLHPLNPDNYVTYCSLIDPLIHQMMAEGDFKGTYEKAVEICGKEEVIEKMAAQRLENQMAMLNSLGYAKTIVSMLKGI
ncbi:MAG: O-antigen ligase family protein, partial [Clostridia bacterium]|nr:O-antigen ligase family protein [Clostridia bacterium]